jgi:putative protein-disulfide isomerase
MDTAVLHYIHDPLCGWCYGAAPLVKAARAVLPVYAHGGGMMAGANRQPVTPQLRAYVLPHDQRIAQLSGQPFGDAYRDGLLKDAMAVFDSAPPITAVLAAESLQAGAGLDLLARLQTAHYLHGRRIADLAVLQDEAQALGLEGADFAAAYEACSGAATQAHISSSRALLARAGGQGFPSFVLERDGALQLLDIGPYLGRPDAWAELLRQTARPVSGVTAQPALCGPDGCSL